MKKKTNIKKISKNELKKVKGGGSRDFSSKEGLLKQVEAEANSSKGLDFHIKIEKS